MYQDIFFDLKSKKVHIWDDKRGHQSKVYKPYAYLKDSQGQHVSLFGDKLTKTYQYDKDDPNLFESDVPVETRVLIDTYGDQEEVSEGHKVFYLDIEVEVTEGFPSPAKAENTITSIGYYDCLLDQYVCLVLDKEKKVDLNYPDFLRKGVEVYRYETEFELLQDFFKKYQEIQPTIVTGWNSEGFDIPYLYNRACKVVGAGVASTLSPIGIVRWSEYKERHKIAGVSHLDYLFLYKNFTYSERSSYRLGDVAEFELGETKVEYDGTLNDLYDNDRTKFVLYNIHDVRLVKRMNDKLDFIDIARAVCHAGYVPYENVFTSSRYLEGAILAYMRKLGVVAPNKKNKSIPKNDEQFTGAYVQEPQSGKHDWVFDLDITSMYPSVIMSLNISPETKVGKVTPWDAKESLRGIEDTHEIVQEDEVIAKMTTSELRKYLEDNEISISSNGILYRVDKQGLIPAILKKWFEERVEYRKLAKKFGQQGDEDKYGYFDRRQLIQKIMLNSLYGALGLPVFRFYDVDNAEATTMTGQSLIKFSKKITNHFYNKELDDDKDYVIYIDTDSIFASAVPLVKKRHPDINVKSEAMMTKRILEIANELQTFLNQSYDYFAKKFLNINEHRFDIKQELIGKAGLFITKKRYGVKIINDNGVDVDKMLIKGIDTVRSSFPPAMGELLKNVLDDILLDVPKEKVDDRILTFKKSMPILGIDKVAIPIGVKNLAKYVEPRQPGDTFSTFKTGAPVHVKAAHSYNDLLRHYKISRQYLPIMSADKIKWVYLHPNPLGLKTIAYRGFEDPPEIMKFIANNINYDKMYTAMLQKKLKMFYDALKWDEPRSTKVNAGKFF